MVQESTPFCCIFLYLELHYYNHWSYIELYIWSTAISLVIIIFVRGSVIHLVIQEKIILWNGQNTNSIVNIISGIKSKYFSHEPPTSNQFFKRSSRIGNGSLKAEIWFFLWFIKGVTLKDSSGMKTQHSVWIMAQVPPWNAAMMSTAEGFVVPPFSSLRPQSSIG